MQPFDNSPRISIDQEEEENAGLLKSYHSSQGEDYPPPASPDTPGVPFNKPSTIGFRFFNFQRPFLALSICLFFGVFLAASTLNRYSPIYDSLSTQGNEGLIRQKMHELPRSELDETKIRIQEATPDYTVTAVVLHGLGQPNHEPPFVRKLAEHFPYVRWVSPTADQLNVAVRDFEPTSAWFNIETFDDLSQGENLDEFVHSQRQLNKLVDDEREKMKQQGKEPRIVLMGFSQGAVMTMLGLLSSEETNRFEGGIALSGYVPLLNYLDDIVSPASRDIPLFWGHGKQDPYLTIEQARAGSKLLRSSRIGLRKLTFKEYDGLDHIWNEYELDDVANWFQRTVPRRRLGRPTFSTKPSSSDSTTSSDTLKSSADAAHQEPAGTEAGTPQEVAKWEKVQLLEDAAEAKVRRSITRRSQRPPARNFV